MSGGAARARMDVGIVEVRRGGEVESRHRVHGAVVDGAGNVVHAMGDPDLVTFLRSAAKPFQALPLVMSGAAERFAVTDAELAVACGSHVGEPMHVTAVARMLSAADLTPDALRCGTHPPRSKASQATPLHHNCSGNHAAMLLLQVHLGGDPARYLDADAPAQRAIVDALTEVAGEAPRLAVDGCGAPAFALPLRATARAFARLALPQGVGKATAEGLARIRRAMTTHPRLVGGEGSFDSDLMDASEDRLVSKAGAEGVQAVGDLSSGLGLALKVEDGSGRAVAPATVEALRQLAWLEGRAFEVLGDWWRPPVVNFQGRVVGELTPVLKL